jgi:RecA/RadA recombinase
MSPEEVLLSLQGGDFIYAWLHLTDDERSNMPRARARYLQEVPEVGATIERMSRKGNGKGNGEHHEDWRERKAPLFPGCWINDAKPGLDTDYLIKGLIERARLHLIYGPSGGGKTFFTIDIAGHIAAGIPWRGRRVHPALVVYVAAEAGQSILRRFQAWRDQNIGEVSDAMVPLRIITRAINFMDPFEVEYLIAELRRLEKEAGLPLGFTLLDTLSRSMPGGDENKAEHMTRVIYGGDLIRDETGSGIGIVHHTGKQKSQGARGHSSLFAAADVVIEVSDRVATVEKSRDGESGAVFQFGLKVLDLGLDSDGDRAQTCFVHDLCTVEKEAIFKPQKRKRLTANACVCLDALKSAISEHGEMLPETSILPHVKAVKVDDWQDNYARIRPISQKLSVSDAKVARNARRMAFRRGQDELQASNAAGTEAGFWWVI